MTWTRERMERPDKTSHSKLVRGVREWSGRDTTVCYSRVELRTLETRAVDSV